MLFTFGNLFIFIICRYTLRCLVAVHPEADCVKTIQTTEEKLALKKKELEQFQVVTQEYTHLMSKLQKIFY